MNSHQSMVGTGCDCFSDECWDEQLSGCGCLLGVTDSQMSAGMNSHQVMIVYWV